MDQTPTPHCRPWSTANHVTAHIHGAAYFDRLVKVVDRMDTGDRLFFTD